MKGEALFFHQPTQRRKDKLSQKCCINTIIRVPDFKMGSEEKKGKGELTYKWGGRGRGGFIRHSSFCACFLLDTVSAV